MVDNENVQKDSIFKKKKSLIAIVAAAAVIIAAVIIIVVTTASSVDKELVGLWYANDQGLSSSYFKVSRNGKCSGFYQDFVGNALAFKGKCQAEDNAMTIEVKEIVSNYSKEEDIISNNKTVGYLIVVYQYYKPMLIFSSINDSGKGYFPQKVLCKNYGTDKAFMKVKDSTTIQKYNNTIKWWFNPDASNGMYSEDITESVEAVTEAETTTQEETTETQSTAAIGGGPHAPDPYVSTVNELMVRTGPGTEYEAFAKLSKGEEFSSLESVNGWAHGYYNGRDGWVSEQYLVSWPAGTGNYSDFEKAIEQFDPMHLSGAVGPYDIQYRGLDSTYVYFQAYAGGGWECVKVTQATQNNPYTVEYMSDAERAQYEQNPYSGIGN